MDLSNHTHVKLAKFLMTCFGLWPHQSQFAKRRNYWIFATWTAAIVIPMAESLLDTPDLDIQLYFGNLVGVTWMLGSWALATMLYARPQTLINLGEHVASDWKAIEDPKELAVMQKFCRQGQSLSFIYTGSVLTAVALFLVIHYSPVVAGCTEESAKMVSGYSSRWLIRADLREAQVVMHIGLELFYGTMVYIVVMTLYVYGVKHICGMNAIVRLRKLMDNNGNDTATLKKSKRDDEIMPELLDIVKKHRSAIKCTRMISRLFSRGFYISHIGELLCLAIFYFGLQFSFQTNDTLLTLKVLCLMVIFTMHMFYLNYGGELIIGYSNEVFKSTYYMNWYLMSPNARRLLILIILRSSKVQQLKAGTMTLSFEYLSKIIRVSWSLASVLSSTQKIT